VTRGRTGRTEARGEDFARERALVSAPVCHCQHWECCAVQPFEAWRRTWCWGVTAGTMWRETWNYPEELS
jgi:hypothetical protein